MPSRRSVLEAGGAAVLAAVAGCTGGGDSPGDETTTESTTRTTTTRATTEPTTRTTPTLHLDGTPGEPEAVPDGATVAVAAPDLHQLVADAADAEGRVDLVRHDAVFRDATLALGRFDYVAFRGERYAASASFARFAEEAAYQYSLVEVAESEVDGDVLAYETLNESERAVADALLSSGEYDVGHHEAKPPGLAPFEQHQYFRKGDTTYRIRTVVGDVAAHHMLALEPADPGPDAQVVTVADRVPESGWADELRAVVQTGGRVGLAGVDDPGALENYFDGVGYVVAVPGAAEVSFVRTVD
ncbi:MAG: hypothetical protein ABEJ88_09060 [Halobacterium sp.]